MKKLAFLVAAASLFAVGPELWRFGPVVSALGLVWLGVLLALFASGSIQAYAVAAGAIGAFGAGVLAPVSPAAAGAVLVAAAFAERSTRVRGTTARAVHVLIAVVAGALAGSCAAAFAGASVPVLAVAVVVSGVLSSLPFLVEADDPVAHALDRAAAGVDAPAKDALLAGAELRRTTEEVPLDRATVLRVKKTWQSLLRLAEARVRLQKRGDGPVREMVNQRLAEHVKVLSRAYIAVDTVAAATVSLDDEALKNVESFGDSLEETSRALVEVR